MLSNEDLLGMSFRDNETGAEGYALIKEWGMVTSGKKFVASIKIPESSVVVAITQMSSAITLYEGVEFYAFDFLRAFLQSVESVESGELNGLSFEEFEKRSIKVMNDLSSAETKPLAGLRIELFNDVQDVYESAKKEAGLDIIKQIPKL